MVMKKCAVFNDICGFGKCSLAASIPILSAMGTEVHSMPTAVLSNQTAYGSFSSVDLTDVFPEFIKQWEKLNAQFDAVLTGYFASEKQIDIVRNYIKESDVPLIVVDPVLGDNGSLYDGFDDSICGEMKKLALCADIITPNITELFCLSGENDIEKAAYALIKQGIGCVVVTGVEKKDKIGCRVFTADDDKSFYSDKTGGYYSGTGDIFSAVLTGSVLRGKIVFEAALTATDFVSAVIKDTNQGNPENGVDFERKLGELI